MDDDLDRRYMMGGCHALAYVLAQVVDSPVAILYAVRKDEGRIPDPLHVFVLLDESMALDVRGERTLDQLQGDFTGMLSMLRRSPDDLIEMEIEAIDSPEALYDELGFCPDAVETAIADLEEGLWDRLDFTAKDIVDRALLYDVSRPSSDECSLLRMW